MRVLSTPMIAPNEGPLRRSDSWNESLEPALVPAEGTGALRKSLRAPGALVVTTGQQPGLFTGPAYTINKAIAAAALARALSARWQRPVVPLFWLAGDDHDHAEASSAAWPDVNGHPVRWSLPARPSNAPQRSMTEEVLPPEIRTGLEQFLASLPAGTARDATARWLYQHYRAGHTIHGAFRDAMAEILAGIGVLCFDPTVPAFKAAQAPLLEQALHRASSLDAILAALPDSGTGISSGDGATLVFMNATDGRDRLMIDGDSFRTRRSGEAFSFDSLRHLLQTEPERFSANVLLRPVVESALLPTAGYLGGPGEYRYLTTQAVALYQPLGVTRQPAIRRWSGTVVEPWADRVAERLGIEISSVMSDSGELGRSLLKRDLPPEVVTSFAELQSAVASAGKTLVDASAALDPGLHRSVVGRQRRLAELIADLERRYEGALRRRSDTTFAQYRRLREALTPFDQPQERIYTGAAWLGRHGEDWLDEALKQANHWALAIVDAHPVSG